MTDSEEPQTQEPFVPTLTTVAMQSVDHMFNQGMLNHILDRTIGGPPTGVPHERPGMGLFSNLVRLTDKSLREYDAARFELLDYLSGRDETPRRPGMRTSPYVRAVDHMENVISAVARGLHSRDRLQALRFGREAPKIAKNIRDDVTRIRDMIEHADDRLTKSDSGSGRRQPFAADEPYALRLENEFAVIGNWMIEYRDIVAAITSMYEFIELLRGVKSAGPDHLQATTRTDVTYVGSPPTSPTGIAMSGTDVLWEMSRHSVSH